MSGTPAPLRGDPLPAEDIQGLVGSAMTGALTMAMVFVGDRLGLYKGMKDLGGPATSPELAAKLGLSERWVREWLLQQASARLVECDARAARFWLTRAQQDVLANEEGPDASPYFFAGAGGGVLTLTDHREELLSAFKTGVGLSYDQHGKSCAMGVKRELGVWTRHFLVEKVSSLPGLLEKLERGAKVADVGCGAGLAVCLLAKAFLNTEVHGYDISHYALDLARQEGQGVPNAHFHDCSRPEGLMPAEPTFDFVMVNDALHDMARPDTALAAIRKAIKPDGSFLICDIKGMGPPAANVGGHPMAALLYGFSCACCMSSGLSEPGGLGLGTLGFHRKVAEKMAREAGFGHFEVLGWQSDLNAYYLVRP